MDFHYAKNLAFGSLCHQAHQKFGLVLVIGDIY